MSESRLDKLTKDFEKESKKFDEKIRRSRIITRSTIHKMIILSSAIVAFSISLFSVPALQSNLNLNFLRWSWYFFLLEIVLGFFMLMFEGRIEYAITWKNNQLSELLENSMPITRYSFKEKCCASYIVLVTLIHPSNLLFNRAYEKEEEKRFKHRVNGLVVQKLAAIRKVLIFLENIFYILFVIGLVLLVMSVAEK